MKKDIHPQWYPQAKITCACGATFTAGSTKPKLEVEICSDCHPFFTGKMRYVDTQGRVEKFQAKQKQAQSRGYIKKKDKRRMRAKEEEEREKKRPKTLKEMLHER